MARRRLEQRQRDQHAYELEMQRETHLYRIRRLQLWLEYANTFRVPISILSSALPIWVATTVAGTDTRFDFKVSFTIIATLGAGAGWTAERLRTRSDRRELARLRVEMDRVNEAAGLVGYEAVTPVPETETSPEGGGAE